MTNSQATNGQSQDNDAVLYLPLIISDGESDGPFFTELAADTLLTDDQQAVLNAVSRDPSTARLSLVSTDASLLKTAQVVEFNIFRDTTLQLNTDQIEVRDSNDFTWYGSDSNTQTQAVIVVRGSSTIGTISQGGRIYKINPISERVHANLEFDMAALGNDHPQEFETMVQEGTRDRNHSYLDLHNTINILVAYTPAAKREAGDIDGLIQLAIDETNSSFRNSNVNKRLVLVHTYENSYAESGDMNLDLTRLRIQNDGFMDEVHSIRSTYNADVVMLMSSRNHQYCGMAYLLASYNSAFGITAQQCATGYYTFGHELGHILGARHNPEVDPSTSPFPYGHGYYPSSQSWRTIMSYNCPNNCRRIPFWSNPNMTYEGVRMGTFERHDNARVLNGGSTPPPTQTPQSTPTPRPTQTNSPFEPTKWYRLTNTFLGEERSLDTYSNGRNDPFMGETGNYSGQYWRIAEFDNTGYYRLTNRFLGEERSLDTYSNGNNDPFMGETGNYSGQYWQIEEIDNTGYYRFTNTFLGEERSLDTYSNGNNDPFMGETGNYSGQYWQIEEIP